MNSRTPWFYLQTLPVENSPSVHSGTVPPSTEVFLLISCSACPATSSSWYHLHIRDPLTSPAPGHLHGSGQCTQVREEITQTAHPKATQRAELEVKPRKRPFTLLCLTRENPGVRNNLKSSFSSYLN